MTTRNVTRTNLKQIVRGKSVAYGELPLQENCCAWFEADNVIQEETAVTRWKDNIAKTYTNEQGTAASRPTKLLDNLGRLPGIDFDGGDFLFLSSGSAVFGVTNGPNTIYAVINQDAAADGRIFNLGEGGSSRYFVRYSGTNGRVTFLSRDASSGELGLTDSAAEAGNVVIVTGRREGTTQAISVNNGTETTDAGGVNEPGVNGGAIGSSPNGLGGLLNGQIYEIIVYVGSHTALERTRVNTYLSNKYGVSL